MLRILVADDHGIVRSGLKMLIERQDGMHVVAEAEDGVEPSRPRSASTRTWRSSTCRCRA